MPGPTPEGAFGYADDFASRRKRFIRRGRWPRLYYADVAGVGGQRARRARCSAGLAAYRRRVRGFATGYSLIADFLPPGREGRMMIGAPALVALRRRRRLKTGAEHARVSRLLCRELPLSDFCLSAASTFSLRAARLA